MLFASHPPVSIHANSSDPLLQKIEAAARRSALGARTTRRTHVLWRMAALTLGLTIAGAVPGGAQSFGRNKVHYGDFDFKILETPHFDIYYYPAEHDASVEAGRLAE